MGWVFEVEQDGKVVASGSAPDRDTALREAGHYVMMYGQDGDCQAIVREEEEPCPACEMPTREECLNDGCGH